MAKPVQSVIHILNRLVLAIRLAGQVANGIVAISLDESRRECRLGDPAARVVFEICCVIVCVGDRGQIALQGPSGSLAFYVVERTAGVYMIRNRSSVMLSGPPRSLARRTIFLQASESDLKARFDWISASSI